MLPTAEPAAEANRDRGWRRSPWLAIAVVGGLCWAVVALTALVWMLPSSGGTSNGIYFVSSRARMMQHLVLFLVAAPCYRLSLALGWPKATLARLGTLFVNLALALIVVSLSQVVLALVSGYVDGHFVEMYETLDSWMPFSPTWDNWATPLRFFLPPYVLGLCAVALVVAVQRQHHQELRAASLASAYAEARLSALSAQLQPHFLFNALHGVGELMLENTAQANLMLVRLGDFLRHALDSGQRTWIELDTELVGLDAYLRVQQARFPDTLTVAAEADNVARAVFVPSLLLQPLAENAIEHGRDGKRQSVQVSVLAKVQSGRLRIVVRNSSASLQGPLPPDRYGGGLRNVVLRLHAAYGDDASLAIAPDAEGGVSANLDLPLRGAGGARLMELQ